MLLPEEDGQKRLLGPHSNLDPRVSMKTPLIWLGAVPEYGHDNTRRMLHVEQRLKVEGRIAGH